MQNEQQTEIAIEALLTSEGRAKVLNDFDPNLVAKVLRRIVERDGCYPASAISFVNGETMVIGPAIRRDADSTYSIHNCCFFVLSKDDSSKKRSRHSLTLDEAVRLFLIAEPFGNYRGYAWAPARW